MRALAAGALAWALASAGCTQSLADAACPCLAGWTCCEARRVCLPDGMECLASDAAPPGSDGSTDQGATPGNDGSTDQASDSGPAVDDGPTGGSDAPLGPYGCATMARFTAAQQVVDGVGDEFDGITPVVFRASDAPWTDTVPPPQLPEQVTFRAAWSPDGFHIHVHVDDPIVIVNPDTSKIWDGDSVEVMVANSTTFTGRFDGSNDGGALHIGVAPPAGYYTARGIIYVDPVSGTNYRYPLDNSLYAGRTVPGGYEVEVYLPWAPDTAPLVPGGSIGFQFAINAQDVPTPPDAQNGRQLTANLPMRAVDPAGCGLVWCDDRTWCRPTLE
jgi:hypothetical protein